MRYFTSIHRVLPRLVSASNHLIRSAALTLICVNAQAGQFTVQPMRLEFASAQRTGALTLRNESPDPLSFRVQALRWTQDEQGQERYADTSDLIYFPRLLTLAPGQSAVIRVGLREPSGDTERTYRLFVEELPAPAPAPAATAAPPAASAAQTGARIRILTRFGAPVFVRASASRDQLEIPAFQTEGGKAQWTVRNLGTAHEAFKAVTLRGLSATGAELFRQELLAERYLLTGATRRFLATLPVDSCAQLARLAVVIQTERSEARREIDASARPCP